MSFTFHLRQLGKFLAPKRQGTMARRAGGHRLQVRALEKRDLMSVVFYPQFGNESAAYQNGQRLVDPPVYLIYWGSYWTRNPTTTPTQVDQAATSFLSGPYLTALSQYGGGIGDAWSAGSVVDTLDPDPTNGFSMTYLEGIVNSAINNLGLPNPGATQYLPIYMVVTPPGIVSDQTNAGGYHTVGVSSSLQELVYGWVGSDGSLPSITTTLSHEVVESISDPLVTGWPLGGITVTPGINYPGIPGVELADNEAQNYTAILNGVTVQSYWSQQDEAFVVPDGSVQRLYVYNGASLYIDGDQGGYGTGDLIGLDTTVAGGISVQLNAEQVAFSPGEITQVIVDAGAGPTNIDVQSVPAGANVGINLGSGVDGVIFSPKYGDLSGIQAVVDVSGDTIDSGALAEVYMYDDYDYLDSSVVYTLTDTSFTRDGFTFLTYTGIQQLGLQGSLGNDSFFVDSTAAGTSTTLSTGTGENYVGVFATQGPLSIDSEGQDTVAVGNGTVANINGLVHVYGGGYAWLNVEDGSDSTAHTATLSDGSLTGLAPANITWNDYNPALTQGGVRSLTVVGSNSINNTWNVYGNGASSSDSTYLLSSSGNTLSPILYNTVNVYATSSPLTIDGGAEEQVVTVGASGSAQAISGTVHVLNSASAGYSELYVYDDSDTTGRTVTMIDGSLTGLAPAAITWTASATGTGGVTYLDVYGSGGSSTYNVLNTSPFSGGTELWAGGNGRTGTNTVNIKATAGPVGLRVNGYGAATTVTVGSLAPSLGGTLAGLNGPLYVNAAFAPTSMIVDDSGDTTARTATITAGTIITWGTITGLANPTTIRYFVSTLAVRGPQAGSTFNIPSTAADLRGNPAPITVTGGAGNDIFNVGSANNSTGVLDNIQGALTLNGGGGTDTLNLFDHGKSSGQSYSVSATTISRPGIARVTFGAMESVVLNTAGSGGNNVWVTANATMPTEIVGNGTGNTLSGPDLAETWSLTGTNAGTVASKVNFVDIQALVGSAATDTFDVKTSTNTGMTIDGGAGTNTLSYSGDGGHAVTVNLASSTANLINGFSHLAKFVGSTASDTLIGPGGTVAWSITALNGGKANTASFSGFENLQGGSGINTFKISNGKGVAGTINGGSGSHNALSYALWGSSGVNANLGTGLATGVAGGISGFTSLIGSPYNDTLTGGSGKDIIRGNGGPDTITGGSGNNILIGGATGVSTITSGSARSILISDKGTGDTLNGGAAGDILIAGYTNYDPFTTANDNALLAVLNEWASGDSYTTRISKIRAGISGAAFNSTTVHTVVGMTLHGQVNYPSDPDWFWAASASEIHDSDGGHEQMN